ncbi:PREDICTED: probable ATP-dependent RNA helicase DDX53 [Polistes dominula]|uniref:Probable ATP-dependent RNA helicase DDX53 n=1 Tax=Polistes dominula TaxID=743375 RepID=A0ABM1IQQ8_POLDO|nr:PREDICTED: probable ATP-dependent RNA helicase DDX53 [Polistes dominula]
MNKKEKVIIFTNETSQIDELQSNFSKADINLENILSLKDINDSKTARFKIEEKTTARIIITTDFVFDHDNVNINDISYVYNYDLTLKADKYKRRSRWAICDDKTGVSIILMTEKNISVANNLITILESFHQKVPEELYDMAKTFKIWQKKKETIKKQKHNIVNKIRRYHK